MDEKLKKAFATGVLSMNISGVWPARFIPRRAVVPSREKMFQDMCSAMEGDLRAAFRRLEESISLES